MKGIKIKTTWPITTSGFLYDREWALVETDKEDFPYVNQKRFPGLCLIQTKIENEKLIVVNKTKEKEDRVREIKEKEKENRAGDEKIEESEETEQNKQKEVFKIEEPQAKREEKILDKETEEREENEKEEILEIALEEFPSEELGCRICGDDTVGLLYEERVSTWFS